jgi:hypothetical protein
VSGPTNRTKPIRGPRTGGGPTDGPSFNSGSLPPSGVKSSPSIATPLARSAEVVVVAVRGADDVLDEMRARAAGKVGVFAGDEGGCPRAGSGVGAAATVRKDLLWVKRGRAEPRCGNRGMLRREMCSHYQRIYNGFIP